MSIVNSQKRCRSTHINTRLYTPIKLQSSRQNSATETEPQDKICLYIFHVSLLYTENFTISGLGQVSLIAGWKKKKKHTHIQSIHACFFVRKFCLAICDKLCIFTLWRRRTVQTDELRFNKWICAYEYVYIQHKSFNRKQCYTVYCSCWEQPCWFNVLDETVPSYQFRVEWCVFVAFFLASDWRLQVTSVTWMQCNDQEAWFEARKKTGWFSSPSWLCFQPVTYTYREKKKKNRSENSSRFVRTFIQLWLGKQSAHAYKISTHTFMHTVF